MRITGERIKSKRFVQRGPYVVAVDIEMVIPVDDPSEPCLESETVELLKEIALRAEQGDVEWLKRHGEVYRQVDAA